jgi:hypothetical protein
MIFRDFSMLLAFFLGFPILFFLFTILLADYVIRLMIATRKRRAEVGFKWGREN